MLPDGLEEAVDQPDELTVALGAAQRDLQLGEVAFEHRPVDLGEGSDGDPRGGQEFGKASDRQDALVGLASAQATAEPPADPPFGQVLQPGLWDPVEPQVSVRRLDAQLPKPPDISGEFHLPSAAMLQLLDLAPRVDEHRRGGTAGGRLPSGETFAPSLFGPVQKRGDTGAGDEADDVADPRRRGLDPPVVVAALEGVLHLQEQLAGELAQIETLVARDRILIAAGEVLQVGFPGLPPDDPVGRAERTSGLDPELAEGDQTGRPFGRRVDRCHGGQPLVQVGAADPVPFPGVAGAKPEDPDAVAAARDLAGRQRCVSTHAGPSGGGELLEVRTSLPRPSGVVADAQASAATDPRAARHRATWTTEDQVAGID